MCVRAIEQRDSKLYIIIGRKDIRQMKQKKKRVEQEEEEEQQQEQNDNL